MTRFSNLVVPKRLDGSLPNSMAPRALIYDPQQVPCESPCPSRKIVVSRVQPSNQKGLAIPMSKLPLRAVILSVCYGG